MKQIIGGLIVISVLFLLSCSKDTEKAFALSMKEVLLQKDTVAFLIGFNEQLPENKQPVCLGFGCSTLQTFPEALRLIFQAEVKDRTIILNIGTIKKSGKCPDYMLYSSSSFPLHNLLKRECAAYGNFDLYNLSRGTYQVELIFMGQTISQGTLALSDNQASIELSGNLVRLIDEKINIIPDSCIFGQYHMVGKFTKVAFDNFMAEIGRFGCREIKLNTGRYRKFEVNREGKIENDGYFVLKTQNNFDEIETFLSDYIRQHPEAYGFIFEDSYGNYHNIKRPPH